MGTMSYVFMGLMVIPLVAFLIWVVKQDRKRSYFGLILLALGIIAASFVIIKYDSNFRLPENLHQKDKK
ncbi:hypothetical protein [Pedobacter flavus]|uniref:Uncharacterized protein n=1 Tax=Pedobacter flavus TaxID=3113906 RepID=A0ABU7H101_9SPHI|nr:hypothetical protein [Pedobacter sp. VNH31]MEE1884982.1 hypothetical protein [Pedobacter sp. VNH31]